MFGAFSSHDPWMMNVLPKESIDRQIQSTLFEALSISGFNALFWSFYETIALDSFGNLPFFYVDTCHTKTTLVKSVFCFPVLNRLELPSASIVVS